MLSVTIDEENVIAILEPEGPLTKNDFESAARVIDSYIEDTNKLIGLIIHTKSFPGWDSFAALVSHLRFVKEHHKLILRVAFSTDSMVGSFAESVASHFVNAEIKHFPYHELEQAKLWIADNSRSIPA
ncbi:STAS/SEC14 domain-containing protein [Gammaproteobacteria bacterium]|nr:STAS/SEC14 domain-containing protein [Gammaproteobacteria bacterium]